MSCERKEIYSIANNGRIAGPAESSGVRRGDTARGKLNQTTSTTGVEVAEESRSNTILSSMNVLMSILECALFSGIQFGWSSLVFVYKDMGLYRDLCPRNITGDLSDTCPEQEERLNMFFSVACALMYTLTIFIGILHRKLGTTKCRLIFVILYPCGLLFLSFTTAGIPWMFFPGLTLTGISGLALIVTDMHVVSYIRRGRAFFVMILNGAFDSSSVTLLIVKVLYQRGMDMRLIFWGIAAVQLVVTLTNTFLHWKQTQVHRARSDAKTKRDRNDHPENEMQTNDKDPTFHKTVCTFRFCLYVIWILLLSLRWISYIGLANRQFSVVLGSASLVSEFTNILSYFLFGGFIVSLITGGILECIKKLFAGKSDVYRRKVYPMVIALSTCSVMSLIMSTLGIVQSANTFYAEFVIIPFFRSFLYSINMNYVVTMFHRKWISTIMGISYTMNGVSTIVQYFIFKWVLEYNTFTQMNYMLLGSSLVSFALPIMLLLKRGHWSSQDVIEVHIQQHQAHSERESKTS